jgi:hypothetical protein
MFALLKRSHHTKRKRPARRSGRDAASAIAPVETTDCVPGVSKPQKPSVDDGDAVGERVFAYRR